MRYSRDIDHKWQKRWEAENLASFDWSRVDKKLYVLEMFSYPSGANLHIGHWYNYSLADSWARMKKLQGYEVFQPMGFDAFGLPAENYAIKTGTHPEDSTRENIETMEKQLKAMGALFNWEHELATCDPEYYRWNQWLFLQLLKHDLAYRKKAPVNWCPSCNTVLANEQVVDDGECERCGSPVERKQLTQWFFKITDYAEELLEKLPELDWPEKTKKIQENWIGRSSGALVDFGLEKAGKEILDASGEPLKMTVFTTRVDTLFGVTYVVVAPEAELTDALITDQERAKVEAYREECKHLSEIERQSLTREKTGVFTGAYAVHPLTGERIPVWTSDYVIASYGTGAVMAVPAHDERDFEFAKKFNLEIKEVILPEQQEGLSEELEEAFTADGILVNSAEFSGQKSAAARSNISKKLSELGMGEEKIMYRLRDWLVSRQRYWGTPIPVVYCDKCGLVPVPEEDLPVKLPYNVSFTPDGESPLKKCREFIDCTCPKCGGAAERDPDTLDTFVCSSWYQFRYVDNKNSEKPFDREKVNQLCPVDRYVGGAEHAAMHLLYARFITKALRDLGYLDFDEPFKALTHQGTILGSDGQKMSKSKGNTVNPDGYIEKHGSDVFRLYLAFGFAYVDGGPWSDEGLKAVDRFLKRVQRLVNRVAGVADESEEGEDTDVPKSPAKKLKEQELESFDKELEYRLHYTIKEITKDAERFQFNTSIARLMELLNFLHKYEESVGHSAEFKAAVESMLILLSPFAPHFTEEAWAELGHQDIIFHQTWPEFDPDKTVRDEIEIAIQINGKLVSRIMVSASATAEEVEEQVKAEEAYSEWLNGRELVRFIYVPKRLANLVVKG